MLNVTSPNATLSGLIPFTRYNVSVKCIPLVEVIGDDVTPHGYWSNTVVAPFTTKPDGELIVACTHMMAVSVLYLVYSLDFSYRFY